MSTPTCTHGAGSSSCAPRAGRTAWWFDPNATTLARFLTRAQFYYPDDAIFAYGSNPPAVAAFPAADVVVDREIQYVVLAPAAAWGPQRAMLLAVRRAGIELLAERSVPPIQRLRYSHRDGALYGLEGNRLLRWRVTVRSR